MVLQEILMCHPWSGLMKLLGVEAHFRKMFNLRWQKQVVLQPKRSCKSTLWFLTKHSQYKHSTYFALVDFVFSWFRIAMTMKNCEIKWSTKISFTLNSTQTCTNHPDMLWYAICDSVSMIHCRIMKHTFTCARTHFFYGISMDISALVFLSFVYHGDRCFWIVWMVTHMLPVAVLILVIHSMLYSTFP